MPSIIIQMISIIISGLIYTLVFNWRVAVVLIIGIAWHEYGHILAAKRLGLTTAGMYMIPFIGGVSLIRMPYRAFTHQVIVALSGPIAGTLLSVACYGLYRTTHLPFLGSAALWMLAMNLFNLVPVAMLDGGQVGEAVSCSISSKAGLWFMGVSTLLAGVGIGYLNLILGLFVLFLSGKNFLRQLHHWRMRKHGFGDHVSPQPTKMDKRQITISVCAYLFVVSTIICLIWALHNPAIGLGVLFHK